MKQTIIVLMAFIVWFNSLQAQQAKIYEQVVEMPTYMYSDPNPVPDMDKSYPYCRYDGYTSNPEQREWKMVILENDYIKVFITPEIGGKIWGAIEKSTGGEFLYFNDAVKFRDVALRGPWTSGGLEYNFGLMSHTSTCATPQDYVLKENPDGSVSCIIGAIDLHTGTRWNVAVKLEPDKAFVETISSFFNTGPIPVTHYHYMNAAAKTEGNLEFIFPGSHHIGHGGEVGDWPVENGRKISFYENNDFGPYKSYHVLNAYTDFMGGYWHDDDFGFGHLCDYDERPGKKLWIWGLSDQGMIWEDLLTDGKGQYIEFQSGKSFNQAMEKSSETPFKHREFYPHDADMMREIWFPLKGTGGMVTASRYGVLNVKQGQKSPEIILSALQTLNDTIIVRSNGRVVLEQKVSLNPLERYQSILGIGKDDPFTVELGEQLLFYNSKEDYPVLDRPLEPNQEFDWQSAVGLFTRGIELEKQQTYLEGNAFVRAKELYLKSLEKDPSYAPALNRLALCLYRQMQYKKALEPVKKSLSINTYDGEANYYYGLIQAKLGNISDAKSGFSIAAQQPAYRTAAYTELACLFLAEHNYPKAMDYAQKAISFNRYNMKALEILAITARQMNQPGLYDNTLSVILDLEATSAFVVYEKMREGRADHNDLKTLVTNEVAYQTYIDLAIRYLKFGFPGESIEILKHAPDHVLVRLWLAFLDEENRTEWLQGALQKPPDFVFPYRTETLEILEDLATLENNWKLSYYQSLIYWKKGLLDEARNLLVKIGNEPDYAPYYLARAKLFAGDPEIMKKSVIRAMELDGNDWRVNLAMIDLFLKEKKYKEAAKLAEKVLKNKPESAVTGISYGIALLRAGEFNRCLDFLESFTILPYEGANEGRNIYHEACIRLSMEALQRNKYKEANSFAAKAKQWPVNLGAGRPYEVDEKLENYISGYCYEKNGDHDKADEFYAKVADDHLPQEMNEKASIYLKYKALRKLNRDKEASSLLQHIEREKKDNPIAAWAVEKESQGDHEAILNRLKEERKDEAAVNDHFLLVTDLFSIID